MTVWLGPWWRVTLLSAQPMLRAVTSLGLIDTPLICLLSRGFPIAEIDVDGSCVIAKHPGTGGIVDVDTVRCQFLYELQGNIYLNSDVSAVLDDIVVEQVGKDR